MTVVTGRVMKICQMPGYSSTALVNLLKYDAAPPKAHVKGLGNTDKTAEVPLRSSVHLL